MRTTVATATALSLALGSAQAAPGCFDDAMIVFDGSGSMGEITRDNLVAGLEGRPMRHQVNA